jgi:hypothetical protein
MGYSEKYGIAHHCTDIFVINHEKRFKKQKKRLPALTRERK